MKIQYTKQNKQRAFTLVEALVAISILMVAIASPLTLAQKGISAAILSRDQMTASFLVQDGIEAVKNIRDKIAISKTLNDGDWLSIYLSSCMDVNYCNIDTTIEDLTTSIKSLSMPNDPMSIMKITNKNGLFLKYDLSTSGSLPSKFSRTINIQKSASNQNEAKVTVRVFWNSPLGQQNIEIKDFIYNYSENF